MKKFKKLAISTITLGLLSAGCVTTSTLASDFQSESKGYNGTTTSVDYGIEPLKTELEEETNQNNSDFQTFSGNGEWDFIGEDELNLQEMHSSFQYSPSNFKSTGGDFMFTVAGHTTKFGYPRYCDLTIRLMEYDPLNSDEIVAEWVIEPFHANTYLTAYNVDWALDGGNGAEFYVAYTNNYYGDPAFPELDFYD
jgi:hypothetical protein